MQHRGYRCIRAYQKLRPMNRALLLFGHADRDTFNERLAAHYQRGYHGDVERIDIASLHFDPVLHAGYRVPQPLEPDLERVKRAIERAAHLVWVFPTYWASPPTIVRGLVDRLFLPGWAFRFEKGNVAPTGLLRGRSARVITTMDSPAWVYTLLYHRPIHRAFGTGTLSFCGLSPVELTAIHGVHSMKEPARARWCERVERIAARDASRRGREDARPIAPRLPERS
jgi:NAD(P)H dehydrogenase (quinone)